MEQKEAEIAVKDQQITVVSQCFHDFTVQYQALDPVEDACEIQVLVKKHVKEIKKVLKRTGFSSRKVNQFKRMAEGLANARTDAAVERQENQRLTQEKKDLQKVLSGKTRTRDWRVIQLENQVEDIRVEKDVAETRLKTALDDHKEEIEELKEQRDDKDRELRGL